MIQLGFEKVLYINCLTNVFTTVSHDVTRVSVYIILFLFLDVLLVIEIMRYLIFFSFKHKEPCTFRVVYTI